MQLRSNKQSQMNRRFFMLWDIISKRTNRNFGYLNDIMRMNIAKKMFTCMYV